MAKCDQSLQGRDCNIYNSSPEMRGWVGVQNTIFQTELQIPLIQGFYRKAFLKYPRALRSLGFRHLFTTEILFFMV